MHVNGTLINYYIHCKRQCYLHGNRINLEDNSELVHIGKALHEEKEDESKLTEKAIDHIRIDKLSDEYLTEIKKSDADAEACKWQLLLYLQVLKGKGIIRKGKLEFIEKNKGSSKTMTLELTPDLEEKLEIYKVEIQELLQQERVPPILSNGKCKKCSYYEYCYI